MCVCVCVCVCVCNINSINFLLCGYLHGFKYFVITNNAILYYEDIRIYRDHKNMTNRLNNCEQANVDKVIATAATQIHHIEAIEKIGGLDLLDEKTKEAAIYRLKYPETSLLELSNIISLETEKKITKSGLNHRFRKIRDLVSRMKENVDKNQ